MSLHRLSILAFVACLPHFACSSTTTPSTEDSGATAPTPSAGAPFRGTLTGKSESGIIDLTLPPGTKTSSVRFLAGPAAANAVNGTINLGNGKTVTLTLLSPFSWRVGRCERVSVACGHRGRELRGQGQSGTGGVTTRYQHQKRPCPLPLFAAYGPFGKSAFATG